ncbi:hypothetical protein GUJ93_ZPchr0010g8166 [Zizania palustris]|uniref:Uncharacterized protein n=1 Tax=Zizania palustris TaxID=103762 RepID=A0A8J6BLS2_ZIZPA|nr:hypothetical protein GUJ93_ZPchr0010g8166 [Zizania palustris]
MEYAFADELFDRICDARRPRLLCSCCLLHSCRPPLLSLGSISHLSSASSPPSPEAAGRRDALISTHTPGSAPLRKLCL